MAIAAQIRPKRKTLTSAKAKKEKVPLTPSSADDEEFDEELEKEANSPYMCALREKWGVLTREEADRISLEARSDPMLLTFADDGEMLKYLHGLAKN
ncbi:MAG: hypothetical protein LBD72_00315 [Puniceicoccales bacterium]|nr:hypothetical protein [Puniceicoccales bacterium]